MKQYIDKNRIEEILRNLWKKDDGHNAEHRICYNKALQEVQCELDTLEVKDANEALHTEYEKGRADVIADTLSWLENCWPRYCSNQTIIEGFKEAIKYD